MKAHTNGFKQNVSAFGRELDSIITYTINDQETTLGTEELNAITPHYEGAILKSVMKELEIDSNVDIPLGTEVNYQFGVKVEGSYEYLNFGNYIVYSSEKQEDLESYKIKCYDKMLYAMKDYEGVDTIYPCTISEYIQELCETIGLTFKNANQTFANYDKTIQNDLYLNLGYTYRDVLDELAQVTASTICINEQDDELEIRYITDTQDTIDEEFLNDVNVNFGQKYGKVNSIVLSRSAESDNVYLRDEESVAEDGLCEIKIKDNQIMNFNDRSDYLPDILEKLDGLEYYINDFNSNGICYYDLCDRYNIQVFGTTYSCVMLNDEILVTQGLEENIHTEMLEEAETDYTKADKTDRKINQAYIIVDKQNQEIEALTSTTEQITNDVHNNYQDLLGRFADLATTDDITTLTNLVRQVQTDTYTKTEIQAIAEGRAEDGTTVKYLSTASATFDENGMHYEKSGSNTASTVNEVGIQVNDTTSTNEELLFAGYDSTAQEALVRVANLYLTRYLGLADWRIEEINDETYGEGIGFFYLK
jgi:hypothetical protein